MSASRRTTRAMTGSLPARSQSPTESLAHSAAGRARSATPARSQRNSHVGSANPDGADAHSTTSYGGRRQNVPDAIQAGNDGQIGSAVGGSVDTARVRATSVASSRISRDHGRNVNVQETIDEESDVSSPSSRTRLYLARQYRELDRTFGTEQDRPGNMPRSRSASLARSYMDHGPGHDNVDDHYDNIDHHNDGTGLAPFVHGYSKFLYGGFLMLFLLVSLSLDKYIVWRDTKMYNTAFNISMHEYLNAYPSKFPYVNYTEAPQNWDNMSEVQQLQWRVLALERNNVDVKELWKESEQAYTQLHKDLPNMVLVHKDEDGNVVIPEQVWQVLAGKINQDFLGKEYETQWEGFLAENNRSLKAFANNQIDRSQHHILDKVEFLKETFENQVNNLVSHAMSNAEEITERTLKRRIPEMLERSLPRAHLEALAQSNLNVNAAAAIRKRNFLAPGAGVVINPYLTSPTYHEHRTFLQRVFLWITDDLDRPKGPLAAFSRWEEFGDCWCSPSDDGYIQVGAVMRQRIVPLDLTIEHIPASASLTIGSAPRKVEVWVEVHDAGERKQLQKTEEDKRAYESSTLPKEYTRIGDFEYDIHDLNHIQTFHFPRHYNSIYIRNVVIRAVGNWGEKSKAQSDFPNDKTCIYRIRMNGEPQNEWNGNYQ